ncbi:MAG: YggS family pyridoxal phosphate-dependent enzyme [Candidatus Competibacteraceae bacterium]|nr:YggS family pyridoxal phosphate-dependent enzyme [Candidatus Competibacteraceae bacterium]
MKELHPFDCVKKTLPADVTLVAVSKTRTIEEMMSLYQAGQRDFGENRVQELMKKKDQMPKDVRWHLIGHLQSNKVKYLVPFITLIHSIDSEKLLSEVNQQAKKQNRIIDCLWQVYVASEETKHGLLPIEIEQLHTSDTLHKYPYIRICGIMAMGTLTAESKQISKEFAQAKKLFDMLALRSLQPHEMRILSMGMSNDYPIAIEQGSTMVRIGSKLFE